MEMSDEKKQAGEQSTNIKALDKVILVWTGQIASILSLVLFPVILACHVFKPDTSAALTFYPIWVWGILGITLSIGSLLHKKYISVSLIVIWLVFTLIFAEEPRSLLRSIYVSDSKWQSLPEEKRVVVVSLNCAGGNMDAVREILPYNPDIVLLQEVPSNKEDIQAFAETMYKGDASIAHGPDTAIIVRGELEEISLDKPKNRFMTQARVRLKSGHESEVICIRLMPPVVGINILSKDCWIEHRDDRKSKRKQIEQIMEQVNSVPNKVPIILGGDFNVPARDGSLRALQTLLSDTFSKGGIGWGHTALNSIPLFRVDQIWTSSDFNPLSVLARKTKHSDHRMVVCYLEVQ
jgi:endonuclease/exonuclease/phosphatase (EEP) superfamily protein YafD